MREPSSSRVGAAQEVATRLVSTVESLHSLWGPRKSALLEGTLIPGRGFSVWSELERTGTRSFGVSGFDAVSWSVRYAFPPDSEGLEHRNSARGLTGKALAGSPLSPYIYCDMVRISVLPLAPLISQHALRNRGRSLGGSAGVSIRPPVCGRHGSRPALWSESMSFLDVIAVSMIRVLSQAIRKLPAQSHLR